MIAAPAVHPVKGTVGSFARVEWGRLFHEHYLAANPHLRSGPTIDPGCYSGGQPTTDSLPRYMSFRTAMVGGPNAFQREADACTPALLKQIKFAQSNGFQVIPTPSHVLGRISPIFPRFSPFFARFQRLDEAVPTSPKPEPRAKGQWQGRPNTVLAA
eukprot:COSAG04_NODE_843_length_9924_cov_28.031349_6_plen_157_part_00